MKEKNKIEKWYYLKIKFKDWYDGRKIWYMNDGYICDCVNLPFKSKTDCESWIPDIQRKYGDNIEKITLHWTR